MKSFGDRIKFALKRKGLEGDSPGVILGMHWNKSYGETAIGKRSRMTFYQWVSDDSVIGKIAAKSLFPLATLLDVNPLWLALGDAYGSTSIEPPFDGLSSEKAELLRVFDGLNSKGRVRLIEQSEELLRLYPK